MKKINPVKKIVITTLLLLSSAVALTSAEKNGTGKDWLNSDVPSIKQTYSKYFESFGIACEYGNWGKGWGTKGEFTYTEVQNGLKKHADSVTMGNCFKPQFIFAWWGKRPSLDNTTFKASNGQVITPPKLNSLDRLGDILALCKANNLKMRGHVLVWHSQTDDAFFYEDYNTSKKLVSKEVMTARQEWYIKTVVQYVNEWEKKNNGGKHIIWAWDVVNEAAADDASSTNYLRGSTNSTKDKKPDQGGSRWYQIYQIDEFIVNAFRFANAYAPKDVKLCYNDYNEYMNYSQGLKTDAIIKIIGAIKRGSAQNVNGIQVKPRIDVMGMQSHVGLTFPTVSAYEESIKKYLALGLDIHVTEFDVGGATTQEAAAKVYLNYFNVLKKYGKLYNGKNCIKNVTVWGINNENSWINRDGKNHPLLFSKKGQKYYTNQSFDSIMQAAK